MTKVLGNELLLFHIGRGGKFNNPGHLDSYSCYTDSILNCYPFQAYCFIKNKDEETGKFCREFVVDGNDNVLMDADDYALAKKTGIGRLEFDGEFDTDYTKKLSDINEQEYNALGTCKYLKVDYLCCKHDIEPEFFDDFVVEDFDKDNFFNMELKDLEDIAKYKAEEKIKDFMGEDYRFLNSQHQSTEELVYKIKYTDSEGNAHHPEDLIGSYEFCINQLNLLAENKDHEFCGEDFLVINNADGSFETYDVILK